MPILPLLFLEFFKIGLFTLGGGLAALPFLYELSDKYGWYTHADVTNMIAVSESTPGPIGLNMATYVGFHTAGIAGGVTATLATILPGILIVLTVAAFLRRFKRSKLVQAGFTGIRPAVAALITAAFWSVFRISVLNWGEFVSSGSFAALLNPWAAALFALALFLLFKLNRHPLWFILGGAVAGILIAP
jgi:chromate transporter